MERLESVLDTAVYILQNSFIQMEGKGDWNLETADDVADKLACNLYERPEQYQKLCDPINHLTEEEREAAMEEKSQVSVNIIKPTTYNHLCQDIYLSLRPCAREVA